jgi:hypothetical protein
VLRKRKQVVRKCFDDFKETKGLKERKEGLKKQKDELKKEAVD